MAQPKKVAIIMGSVSDRTTMMAAEEIFHELDIEYDIRVMSAHRTPSDVEVYAKGAYGNGVEVIIAAAGMSAHLAGVIAANTIVPVLGVPMAGGALNGMDALLSTVNMPGGVPVLTLGIGKAGAKNAALAAAQMLAVVNSGTDIVLYEKLRQFRNNQADKVRQANQETRKL